MNTSAAIALASFDLAILGVLQNDNTVPHRLIGEQVNLSAPSVQRRIRRMEKSGVIAANTAVLDPGRTGQPLTIIVEMELVSETASGIDQIKRLFAETPQIQQCYYVTGEADFVLLMSVARWQNTRNSPGPCSSGTKWSGSSKPLSRWTG